jgi:dTDP-glucose 4,6-dehydratase
VNPLPTEDLEHILSHTDALWANARGRRLFITGGTGFFGTWLLESFAYCNRKRDVKAAATVLTRDPAAFKVRMPHLANEPSIDFLRGEICDFDFPNQDLDYIIHAAAATSATAASQPIELMRTLIRGAERVVALAESRGTRHCLLTSSGAVYGAQPKDLTHVPESYLGGPNWLDPKAAYAEGKRIAELMCAVSAGTSDIRYSIARCFAFVGPHLPLDQHFAIGNFIGDVLAGRKVTVRGDGSPLRSYLYAADLAIWLWTMLLTEAQGLPNPLVINVGSGQAVSIRELAELVVTELNPSSQVEIPKARSIPEFRERYIPDVQRAEVLLGLKPSIGLSEAIRRTATWYRDVQFAGNRCGKDWMKS